MKVYIASSWKNRFLVRQIAEELERLGFEVYDFTSDKHFVFNITEDTEKARSEIDWIECGKLPATQLACDYDKAGLDWADVGILLHPCGRSAHMEAGILIGQGKPLIIYGTLPRGEFEVQYNLTPHRYTMPEWNAVVAALYQTEIDLKKETSRRIMERGLS
jgi:hypothetical protein